MIVSVIVLCMFTGCTSLPDSGTYRKKTRSKIIPLGYSYEQCQGYWRGTGDERVDMFIENDIVSLAWPSRLDIHVQYSIEGNHAESRASNLSGNFQLRFNRYSEEGLEKWPILILLGSTLPSFTYYLPLDPSFQEEHGYSTELPADPLTCSLQFELLGHQVWTKFARGADWVKDEVSDFLTVRVLDSEGNTVDSYQFKRR